MSDRGESDLALLVKLYRKVIVWASEIDADQELLYQEITKWSHQLYGYLLARGADVLPPGQEPRRGAGGDE